MLADIDDIRIEQDEMRPQGFDADENGGGNGGMDDAVHNAAGLITAQVPKLRSASRSWLCVKVPKSITIFFQVHLFSACTINTIPMTISPIWT